jgi:hypothetical protein
VAASCGHVSERVNGTSTACTTGMQRLLQLQLRGLFCPPDGGGAACDTAGGRPADRLLRHNWCC